MQQPLGRALLRMDYQLEDIAQWDGRLAHGLIIGHGRAHIGGTVRSRALTLTSGTASVSAAGGIPGRQT